MPVAYIEAITERYEKLGYAAYQWVQAEDPPPFAPLRKPLKDCRIGMLSTSGAYVIGQEAYFYKDDTSIRAIAATTDKRNIHFSHLTENYLPGPRRDPGCMVPIDALLRLEAEYAIGAVTRDVISCMGAVYSQRRVREELAPSLLETFQSQHVDAVLLVPM
jgi:D-proline reductase (dithiol) PrdB